MLSYLTSGSTLSRVFIWVALAAIVTGFAGNLEHNLNVSAYSESQGSYASYLVKLVFDSLAITVRIFFPTLKVAAGTDSWLLTIARLCGGLASFAATMAVLLALFRDEVEKFKIRFLKGHSIIVGYDPSSEKFATSLLDADHKDIVLVDIKADAEAKLQCRASGLLYMAASLGTLNPSLSAARILDARSIVVNSGDDERNLTILEDIVESRGLKANEDLSVFVTIENARLVDQLQRNDTLLELGGASTQIRFFNFARQTAIALIERTPFVDLAMMRSQRRVHLVVLGHSDTAVECVLQFLRISPAIGLDKPRIDWIVEDVEEMLGVLKERNEALGALVEAGLDGRDAPADQPLAWALDIAMHGLPIGAHIPGSDLLQQIDHACDGQVTAIIVAGSHHNDNIQRGMALRDRCKRHAVWSAPVYAWSQDPSALDIMMAKFEGGTARRYGGYLDHLPSTRDVTDAFEPFGRIESVCHIDNLDGEREKIAMKVHEAYRTERKIQAGDEPGRSTTDATLLPWAELSETYRIASRRAADHVPVKLLSAGLQVKDLGNLPSLPAERLSQGDLLEKLSELEHMTWRIDRELDGWRYGETRDNVRRLHPDIKPYDQLSDAIKEFDRIQVRLISAL
ncbi:MAG: RyR domain-containing protein [Alphaproteobacteria bacterium]|nr:RyR domain-containing protein [Alphaproteobacteria bacterium]